QANLSNRSGPGVLLHNGRFQTRDLEPGAEWIVPFTFQVLPDFTDKEAKLELAVVDTDLRVYSTEKIAVPIHDLAKPVKQLSQKRLVALAAGTEIRESPSTDAPVIARVEKPVRLLHLATGPDGYERINLGGGRPGWVRASDLSAAKGQVSRDPALAWMTRSAPPELQLVGLDDFVTRDDTLQVRGAAIDQDGVRDLYIFSSGRKVYYESNQRSRTPEKLEFDAEIPMQPGLNTIIIVAREDSDSEVRHYFTVRRDAEDGSLLETPTRDDWLFGNGH
ncbi:MAG: hypothetical protein OER77_08465, partial [Myxococcales bacterium]|nr:hypothetical protein [Myxococcales bacterium]